MHGHYENWRSRIEKTETVNGLEVATFADKRETYPDNDLPSATFFNKGLADISTIGIDKLPAEIEFIPASKDCHGFIDMNNPFLDFDLLDEKVKGKYSIHGEVMSPFDYLLDFQR